MARACQLIIRRHTSSNPWTYADLNRAQREIAQRVQNGGDGAVLISEVAPVITVGRRTLPADLLLPKTEFERAGIEILATDRGGLATYHGPGQWILFVVQSLEALTGSSRGVRAAVQGLLEIGKSVASEFGKQAEIHTGEELGVWSPDGKIAAVGVHIESRILLHGLSLNGFKTNTSFLGLKPCGLDKPVDYLLSERRKDEFEKIADVLASATFRQFDLQGSVTI